MSGTSLASSLVGAIVIGWIFGYSYVKLTLKEKYLKKIKNLNELINQKEVEYIELKKEYRKSHRDNIKLNSKIKELEKKLNKKKKMFDNLKSSILTLRKSIKDKKEQLQELEKLILDIQNDYTQLEKELQNEREEFKQKVKELTQKANNLYMIKGTEELKNAKQVFDALREKSLNNL